MIGDIYVMLRRWVHRLCSRNKCHASKMCIVACKVGSKSTSHSERRCRAKRRKIRIVACRRHRLLQPRGRGYARGRLALRR